MFKKAWEVIGHFITLLFLGTFSVLAMLVIARSFQELGLREFVYSIIIGVSLAVTASLLFIGIGNLVWLGGSTLQDWWRDRRITR